MASLFTTKHTKYTKYTKKVLWFFFRAFRGLSNKNSNYLNKGIVLRCHGFLNPCPELVENFINFMFFLFFPAELSYSFIKFVDQLGQRES